MKIQSIALLGVLALSGCRAPLDPLPRVYSDHYDGCICSVAAMSIALSLDAEPQKWHGDSFRLTRGVDEYSIWIANEEYGLRVSKGRYGPEAFNGEEFKDDRAMIWRAYQRWVEREILR